MSAGKSAALPKACRNFPHRGEFKAIIEKRQQFIAKPQDIDRPMHALRRGHPESARRDCGNASNAGHITWSYIAVREKPVGQAQSIEKHKRAVSRFHSAAASSPYACGPIAHAVRESNEWYTAYYEIAAWGDLMKRSGSTLARRPPAILS